MRTRAIVAAALAAASLAGAAQAHAAAISVNAGCFIEGTPIQAAGGGFTAGGPVNYSFDGQLSASGAADAGGNVSQQLVAPTLPAGTLQHTFNLAAQDQTNPALSATTPVNVTAFGATVNPSRARPARKVRFGIHGMPPGAPVYLHYVYKKHVRATVRLGKAKAPCGSLSVRRRFFPMSHPHTGSWIFQFDDKKHYSAATRPAIRGPVLLFNTFK